MLGGGHELHPGSLRMVGWGPGRPYLGAHWPSSNTKVRLVWPPPRAALQTSPGLCTPSGSGIGLAAAATGRQRTQRERQETSPPPPPSPRSALKHFSDFGGGGKKKKILFQGRFRRRCGRAPCRPCREPREGGGGGPSGPTCGPASEVPRNPETLGTGSSKAKKKNPHVNPWLIHVNARQKPLKYCN